MSRIHRIAASAQTGVALSLLVVCSLFLRVMDEMSERDLGFEPHNLVISRIDLLQAGYETPEQTEIFLRRLRQSVSSLPGVTSMSISDGLPLDLVGNYALVSRADRPDEDGSRLHVEFTRATEDFFETIGTPILQGRGFESTDRASSEPVVVITRALADQMWPGEGALGRQLRVSLGREQSEPSTVVGVVPNVASSRPSEDKPHVYVSLRQQFESRIIVLVRSTADAVALIKPIQSAVLQIDPNLTTPEVVTSESLVARSMMGQRATAGSAAGLGVLALLLSAIGVYGVVAFAVACRTREIGIRMAMGATRQGVLRTVLLDGVRLAVPGLFVGSLLALGTALTMRSMLLGMSPLDPVSLGAPAVVLFGLVLLASLVPALRASKIEPIEALHCD